LPHAGIGLLAGISHLPASDWAFWLAFTDTMIGRRGRFCRIGKLPIPADRSLVVERVFYSGVSTRRSGPSGNSRSASGWRFLLNNHFPFKAFCAPSCCCVDRAYGAFGAGVLVDLRSAILIISYLLVDGCTSPAPIRFPRKPWPARFSLIAANIWRGIPRRSRCCRPAHHIAFTL